MSSSGLKSRNRGGTLRLRSACLMPVLPSVSAEDFWTVKIQTGG